MKLVKGVALAIAAGLGAGLFSVPYLIFLERSMGHPMPENSRLLATFENLSVICIGLSLIIYLIILFSGWVGAVIRRRSKNT